MLNDLDESIKQLLIQGGRFDPSQIDISFELPNREWSEKLGTRPTINCYLFDIHERRLLREEGWQLEGRGTRASARRAPPLFFELTYLITAWTRVIEDEHFLLWRALETLMDRPILPEAYLHGALRDHPGPIHTSVAQLEGVLKSPGEFWTALENQLKPSLSYVLLVGRERRPRPTDAAPVRSAGIRLRLPEVGASGRLRLRDLFVLPESVAFADVAIELRPLDPESGAPGEVVARPRSDDDGLLGLDLPPGRYLLSASFGSETRQSTLVVSGAEDQGPWRLRDTVRDQTGAPLPGVAVEVERLGLRTVTDAQGRFEFELPPGSYTLRLLIDGRVERRPITVREPFQRVTLGYGGIPS